MQSRLGEPSHAVTSRSGRYRADRPGLGISARIRSLRSVMAVVILRRRLAQSSGATVIDCRSAGVGSRRAHLSSTCGTRGRDLSDHFDSFPRIPSPGGLRRGHRGNEALHESSDCTDPSGSTYRDTMLNSRRALNLGVWRDRSVQQQTLYGPLSWRWSLISPGRICGLRRFDSPKGRGHEGRCSPAAPGAARHSRLLDDLAGDTSPSNCPPCGLSRSYFTPCFKQITGCRPPLVY